MRHGLSVSVSMAIGMAIFVLAIATTFILLQGTVLPNSGFSEQVVSTTTYAVDRFMAGTTWTVHRQPVVIHSDTALANEPLELTTPLPPSTVPESIAYVRDGREIVSQHDAARNTSVVVTDVRNGTTRIDTVYTTRHDLPDREYTSSLTVAGNSTWNSRMNVTFTDTGFQQITYNGTEMLTAPASIDASTAPRIEEGLLRANVTYSEAERKTLRLFAQSGQIRYTGSFTGEQVWTVNLTDNLTTLYSSALGGTQDLSGTGELYADTTDFIDFYNRTGIAFIGDDLTVNVSRDGPAAPIDVRINFTDVNGEKPVLLYLHDRNYTAAVPYKQNFYDPYTVSIGTPAAVTGVSRSQAAAFDTKSNEQVRDALGLVGSAYNLSLAGLVEAGQPVTADTTVHAVSFPVPVLDRFANATARTFQLRVWNQ